MGEGFRMGGNREVRATLAVSMLHYPFGVRPLLGGYPVVSLADSLYHRLQLLYPFGI